jgi:hypothetical protein
MIPRGDVYKLARVADASNPDRTHISGPMIDGQKALIKVLLKPMNDVDN